MSGSRPLAPGGRDNRKLCSVVLASLVDGASQLDDSNGMAGPQRLWVFRNDLARAWMLAC